MVWCGVSDLTKRVTAQDKRWEIVRLGVDWNSAVWSLVNYFYQLAVITRDSSGSVSHSSESCWMDLDIFTPKPAAWGKIWDGATNNHHDLLMAWWQHYVPRLLWFKLKLVQLIIADRPGNIPNIASQHQFVFLRIISISRCSEQSGPEPCDDWDLGCAWDFLCCRECLAGSLKCWPLSTFRRSRQLWRKVCELCWARKEDCSPIK